MKVFKTQFRVRYAETDAAGIVYYSNFFIYFEVGKMEMFRELNLPYDSRLPMVEAHCDFKSPARFDEIIEVHTYIPETYEKGFKIGSEVYKIEGDSSTELAKGYTVHITTDEDRKPIDLPDYFKKAFDESN